MIRKISLSILLGILLTVAVNSTGASSSHEIPANLGNAVPIVGKLDGDTLIVEDSGDNFILRKGAKVGKISKTELPEEDKFSEIVPSGELFGKLIGTKYPDHFTFIEQPSLVEELRELLEQKFKEVFEVNSLDKRIFSSNKYFIRLELAKQIKIHSEIFNCEFVEKFSNLLLNIQRLYNFDWPLDIENFKDLYDMTRFLVGSNTSIRSEFYGSIMHRYRSIDFVDKKLRFISSDFDICLVDQIEDRMRFKVSKLPVLIESDKGREHYLEINISELSRNSSGKLLLLPTNFDHPIRLQIYYFAYRNQSYRYPDRRNIDFSLNYIPFNLISNIRSSKNRELFHLVFIKKWLDSYFDYLSSELIGPDKDLYRANISNPELKRVLDELLPLRRDEAGNIVPSYILNIKGEIYKSVKEILEQVPFLIQAC